MTLQGDPRNENDASSLIRFALENRVLGANFMARIPVIRSGLEAMEECVVRNIPVCATEVFSIPRSGA